MGIHKAFIETPICSILEDAAFGLRHLSAGAFSIPLADYILQSAFMKMTGFQEQKCKCIIWELATVDYEYRYKALKNGMDDCSSHDEKTGVLKALCERIKGQGPFGEKKSRQDLVLNMQKEVRSFYDACSHLGWFDRDIVVFNALFRSGWETRVGRNTGSFFNGEISLSSDANDLLGLKTVGFRSFYETVVYRHRNRCAHNTTAYHGHRLSLEVLASKENSYENYLVRFGILILMDDILRETFKFWNKCSNVLY